MSRDPLYRMADVNPAFAPVTFDRDSQETTGKSWVHVGWNQLHPIGHCKILREIVEKYGEDPKMRAFTTQILSAGGIPPREYTKQAAFLLSWVQQHIYYANEPGECIQSPWWTLRHKTGDCDDLAVLLATLCDSIGLEYRFVLAGMSGGQPARWIEGTSFDNDLEVSHIYIMIGTPALRPSVWHPAEPTLKGCPLGWDVVIHGAPHGTSLGEDLPTQGMRRAAMGALPPYASRAIQARAALLNEETGEAIMEERRGGLLSRAWQSFDGPGLFNGVLQAVAIALVLGYLDRKKVV